MSEQHMLSLQDLPSHAHAACACAGTRYRLRVGAARLVGVVPRSWYAPIGYLPSLVEHILCCKGFLSLGKRLGLSTMGNRESAPSEEPVGDS